MRQQEVHRKDEVIASCHFTQRLFNFQSRLGDRNRKENLVSQMTSVKEPEMRK